MDDKVNKIFICVMLSLMTASMNAGRLKTLGFYGSQGATGAVMAYGTAILCKATAEANNASLCSTIFAGGLASSLLIPDAIEKISLFREYQNNARVSNKGRIAYILGLVVGFERFMVNNPKQDTQKGG